jgi:hypothetical protein
MDVGQIATGMALSNTASTVTMSVMKDAQNLEQDLVARLFGSIGLGNGVNALA